jgi:hypothetical protein
MGITLILAPHVNVNVRMLLVLRIMQEMQIGKMVIRKASLLMERR